MSGPMRSAHIARSDPARPAHIAVNGLFLDHPQTGTGVYTREVLARLLPSAHDSAAGAPRYSVLGHPEHAAEFASRAPYVRVQGPLRRRADKAEKVWWEQVALPLAVARLGADLLYAPYFSLPRVVGTRTVVTIHDLIPLVLPEYAPSAPFQAYFKLVSAATRRAGAVVTDSRHSAADIVRLLGVPPERVHVVLLGVDERYSRAACLSGAELAALRARLGLPERFILYLGGTDPRKNLGVLLRAVRLLRERGRRALPLVLAVPRGGRFGDPRDEAARLGLADDVIFLEPVPEREKPALYAAAAAFAFPSRYEGFGLPPLEAMASGTPVLCANASSLPEVVGESALLLAPDDDDAWAEAMERIGEDESLRARLAAAGRARAAAFTWDATASGLRDVFTRVLAT